MIVPLFGPGLTVAATSGDAGSKRCPVLRTNYLDRLLATYPTKFAANNNKFAVLTFDEFASTQPLSTGQYQLAENYIKNNECIGFAPFTTLAGLFGKTDLYANLAASLPTFECKNYKTVQNPQQHYFLEFTCPHTLLYIAMGSILLNTFGFEKDARVTRSLYSFNADYSSKTLERTGLHIVYDRVRNGSLITPCTARRLPHVVDNVIAPAIFTDGEKDAATVPRFPWSLPLLNNYLTPLGTTDYETYLSKSSTVDTSIAHRTAHPINFLNADEIFLYTDSVEPTYHIADHLSPLLAKIPAPTFAFGNKLENPLSRAPVGTSIRKAVTHSLKIKQPTFRNLMKDINLSDMSFLVRNSFNDPISPDQLEFTFLLRRKKAA
eukprot:gene14681-biopygen11779